MATALSNLLALLALDNSSYLDGLTSSKAASDSFADKLSNVGGAIVVGGLSVAAAAITAVGVAAWDAGNTMDDAMDTIAVSTGATGPALDGLREDFEAVFTSVPTDAATAADAIGILNSRLDLTGPALQNIAKPLLEATRILGGDITTNAEAFTRVMGDWNLPTEKAAGSLGALFVASQQTGAPLEQLMDRIVQYGAPMRNFGFDFNEAAAILATFEAQGVNTEIVMGGLRTAQGKFITQGKDMKTGLWDTVDAIKNAESSTDALAIATEVFGAKAAGDMFDTIRSGKLDVDGLVQTMLNADGAIMEAGAATADWGEKWTMFKNKITTALAPIGEKMMEGVGKAMDSVVAIFERPDVQAGLTRFVEMIGSFITKAVEYIPVLIDGFFQFIAFLQNNQGIVIGILAALGVAALAWGITTAIAAWTALAPLLPVIAVILLIAGAAYLLYEAWTNNWGGIQEKVAAAWAVIQPVLQQLWDWLSTNIPLALQTLSQAWDGVMQFINDLVNGRLGMLSFIFTTAWANIQLIFAAFKAAFSGDWTRFGELLRQVWDNSWMLIAALLNTAWENIKTGVANGIQAVIAFFRDTDWASVGHNILEGIANGITGGISMIVDAAKGAAQAALQAAQGFLGIHSPSKVFEMQVGWQMAAGVASGWETGLDSMLSLNGLSPANIDLQPRGGSVSAETGGQSSAVSTEALLQEVRRMIADLPNTIARANQTAFEKVTVSRTQ